MKHAWIRINSYRTMNADGQSEIYHLEKSSDSEAFRIVNDFGNSYIEMDIMSGYEMIKKIKNDYEKQIEKQINKQSSKDNCQSDDYRW